MRQWNRHDSLKEQVCWYCGEKGKQMDHFPPVSVEQEYPDIGGWLVRCCGRCKVKLSNSMQPSLDFRRFIMRGELELQYQIQKYVLERAPVLSLIKNCPVSQQVLEKMLADAIQKLKPSWLDEREEERKD